jgi:HAD superfamily hydrolase (TIGR01509 family)
VSGLAAVLLDLDDTLLDTAGLLLGPARLEAGAAMVAAGWPGTAEEAATGLERLSRERPHDDPFHALAEERGADPFRAGVAGWGAFHRRSVPESLPLVPGAAEALDALRAGGTALVLVTFGDPPTQEAKVRATGLAPLLDGVRYEPLAASPDKARAFREICAVRGLDPARCAAVGDRPDAEIAAGRALGMRTVRLRRGEHAFRDPRGPHEEADATVPDFAAAAALLLRWARGEA